MPASERDGAGMRRHVHPGNHAAESFVSFMRLFDGLPALLRVRPVALELLAFVQGQPGLLPHRRVVHHGSLALYRRDDGRIDPCVLSPQEVEKTLSLCGTWRIPCRAWPQRCRDLSTRRLLLNEVV